MSWVFNPFTGTFDYTNPVLTVTLTANSTATSGFSAGQYLYSDGSKLQAGTFGTGVATALGNAVNGTGGVITFSAFAPANGKSLTLNNTLTLAGTDSTTMTFPPASASVGYLNIPQNSQTINYTTVLADSGKHIIMNGTSLTLTIDSNANVPYATGTAITIVNANSTNLTISITSDTLTLAGTTTTGSRTLGQNGIATAIKIGTTSWLITGTGLS